MANLTKSSLGNRPLFEFTEITTGIFESCPDCVKLLDINGDLLAMNKHGQCALEIDDFNSVLGSSWESFWPEVARPTICKALDDARNGETGHFEAFCATAKGNPRWWDVKVNLIRGTDGQEQGFLSVSRDITAIYRVNAELRISEERFRSLVAATSEIVWTATPSGTLMTEQSSWTKFTGQSAHEAGEWGWLDAVHPEDRESVEIAWKQAVATRTHYKAEYRIRRADGQYRCTSVRAIPIVECDGNVREWVGVHADVTDRKRAEDEERRATVEAAAAVEANAKYRTFFEQGSNFAGIMDLDGTVVEVNRLCLAACGFPPSEIIGRKFWDCAWWNEVQETTEMIRVGAMQAAAGELFRREAAYRTAEATERYVDLILAPVSNEKGQVLFVAATGTDITERKQVEKRLTLLDKINEITRTTADPGVIMTEIPRLVGQYLGVSRCAYADVEDNNNEFTIRHDWTAEAVASSVGAYSLNVFGPRAATDMPAGRTLVIRNVDAEMTSSEGADTFNAIGVKAIICCPLVKEGRLVAMMAVHQTLPRNWTADEITLMEEVVERSWAHIERARADKALRDADRRKTEFLATLAHELRNPLAPIRNGLQVMRLAVGQPETVARVRDMMERQLIQLVHLVNDLLDIARITNGKVDLQKKEIAVKNVIASAVETSLPLVEASDHELIISMPEESLLLEVDSTRIAQVLANLLNNAAKYTPPGGRITISTQREENDVVILVTDTGLGIPKESLRTVFDMFTQVKRNSDRAQGGLGIGLSLVRRIVELHGGAVSVSSAGAGKGSTFSIRLPLAKQNSNEPVSKGPCSSHVCKNEGKEIRVLVVDDNADAAESMAAILSMKGYLTRVANDGQQALQVAREFQPQVVFLDIGMPGMNGYEVAKALRDMPEMKAVMLVALTGWGAEEDRASAQRAGFNEHLTKPAHPAAVDDLLSKFSRLPVSAFMQ